ncbi:MAG: LLM class flavin-dependent oxidoreductase [Chloroflexota bacterium]|nr:LLM class flavin-dependent oxidoreductase [Chloroflexota bacterium]MDE2894027.1 LLM class flavin-dependent oxidoreductase [Chloroflexota bacterium]
MTAARRRISVNLPWNPDFIDTFIARARLADEIGVDTISVLEGYGHDAFTGMALLAYETKDVRIASSIVNVFSRTPATMAQSFGTVDQLSGGRVVVGLGASAPGAIERFHGVRFERPFARIRETVELIRLYWARERFSYDGPTIHVERALVSGMVPAQPTAQIHLATLNPTSVKMTAEIADGWMPTWIPNDRVAESVQQVKQWSVDAGRSADAVEVRSPGSATVVVDSDRQAEIDRGFAQGLAFFAVRNGPGYFRQFERQGFADEVAAMREAWQSDGVGAATEIANEIAPRFSKRGSLDDCAAHLDQQSSLGVDLHQVSVDTDDDQLWADVLADLVG